MFDPWLRIAILRVIILLASLPCIVLAACKQGDPRPLPMQLGDCKPAEYTRTDVTARRCSFEGQVWLCIVTENRCQLVTPIVPAPAEAPSR